MSLAPSIGSAANSDEAAGRPLTPRRFKWLRRFGVAAAVVLVGVCLLRVLWGFAARHRLDAQLEQYRGAGQPVLASEFNEELDSVDERLNAAARFEEAMEAIVATSTSGVGYTSFLDDSANFESNMPAARELMAANAGVFRLVREARHLPDVAWSSRVGSARPPFFLGSQQRLIARLLWFATAYHFRNGDHNEAVTVLRDYLSFNNAVDSEPTVISSLVAWACYDVSFTLLEEFLDGLQVGDSRKDSTASISAAPREDVESLLRELLAEDSMRRNAVRMFYGSRASTVLSLETTGVGDWLASNGLGPLSGSPWKQIINVMVHPALVLDTVRAVGYDMVAATAATEETWPEASRHFVPETVNATLLYCMTRPLTYTQFGSAHNNGEGFLQVYFKILARRRMAAVAVAIRLYELDHGRRPSHLSALAPTYLRELPRDPFAASPGPFGYKPDADRPFIYSVGLDGKDNEGKTVHWPDGMRDYERSDIAFYLEPEPVSSSSGEANDDDEDVEHEQGEQDEQDPGEPKPNQR